MDFLKQHKAKNYHEQCTVSFKSSNTSESRETNEEPSICHISLDQELRTCVDLVQTVSYVVIEPHSECTLPVKISCSAKSALLVYRFYYIPAKNILDTTHFPTQKCKVL